MVASICCRPRASACVEWTAEVRTKLDFPVAAGPAASNQELASRQAAATVRSLTLTRQIPLRPLQTLGVGAVQPVAENRVRAGRGEPLQTGGAKPG